MDGVGDELLAGPRFAPDEHGGVGARDLGDLLVSLPHGAAGSDQVGEIVALLQLVLEVHVFVEQAFALVFDGPSRLERLGDHPRHNREEPDRGVVVAAGVELEVHRQGPQRGPVQGDGDADVAQLRHPRALSLDRPVEEERLAADGRHHDRLSALHHAPRDALAQAVAGEAALHADAYRGLDADLVAVGAQHHDRAAHRLVVPLELLQDPLQGVAELGGAGEHLADLLQGGEPPQVGPRLGPALRHSLRVDARPLSPQVERRICRRVRRFRQLRRTRLETPSHSWIWMPSW